MLVYDTPGPITATVEFAVGDLRVVAGDKPETTVLVRPADENSARDVRTAEQTEVEFARGVLTVRGPRQPGLGVFGRSGAVDVLVELPSGSGLDVRLGAGTVRCAGALGGCRLRSGAGDLQIDRAESLHVSTGMGMITAEHVAGEAKVTTGSGKLRVRSVAGPAELKNGNGAIWVGQAAGELRINSANGDITADHTGAAVTANTAHGEIHIGEVVRGVATLRTAAGRIEVGIRPGTAARLDVHTRYGKVRNEMTASSGPAETDEQAEVRASTAFGDILIRRA